MMMAAGGTDHMILILHNRYRHVGGEERAVADQAWLLREHLGEEVEVLERDSALLGAGRAAVAMLRGGLDESDVAAAVRRTGARVVAAHNTNPSFGWRALAAAREAGAQRIVLHLHNYRLVCAVGTCVNSRGQDCLRCQGRDTAPGVALRCRGSVAESVTYAGALSAWAAKLVRQADAVVVPSASARDRLEALRAPLGDVPVHVVPHVLRSFATESRADRGEHALVVGRLAPEKGIPTAVEACRLAGIPLVVAGDGPLRDELPAGPMYLGAVDAATLADLRARARVALVLSTAAETFGLSALEAMADGVPVVAAASGALRELAPVAELVTPEDAASAAAAARRVAGDTIRGAAGIRLAQDRSAAKAVAPTLAAVYASPDAPSGGVRMVAD
jgi:glycosyltransferase involved in cell wall biosynthesis